MFFIKKIGIIVAKLQIPAIIGGDWNAVLHEDGHGMPKEEKTRGGWRSDLFPIETFCPIPEGCKRWRSCRIDFFVVVRPDGAVNCDVDLTRVFAHSHYMHSELYDHDPIIADFAVGTGAEMPRKHRWPASMADKIVRIPFNNFHNSLV